MHHFESAAGPPVVTACMFRTSWFAPKCEAGPTSSSRTWLSQLPGLGSGVRALKHTGPERSRCPRHNARCPRLASTQRLSCAPFCSVTVSHPLQVMLGVCARCASQGHVLLFLLYIWCVTMEVLPMAAASHCPITDGTVRTVGPPEVWQMSRTGDRSTSLVFITDALSQP